MSSPAESPAVSIAWASCPRWAVRESADIVDVIEQPGGQTCISLLDVQGTGASPRRLGQALLLEARSLLSGGVSADLVAQALNQLLHSWREGQVGASVIIASVSPTRCRIELAGYGDASIAVRGPAGWSGQEMRGLLAGHDPGVGPDVRVISLEAGAVVALASDGIARTADALLSLLAGLDDDGDPFTVANGLIAAAIDRDQGRPSADMASISIQVVTETSTVATERGMVVRPVRTKTTRL